MTGCTNCFGGCVSTTSDKCVKYTGNDITFLNIHTGDTLLSVEEAITDYLSTVLNGSGILPVIEPIYLCTKVNQYLVDDPTLIDVLTAIIRTICDVEAEIVVERGRIDAIEANYTVGCLTVDGTTGTHSVLEAVITALCTAIGNIETLNNLFATCITTSNINTYIKNYIDGMSNNNMYTKMVPYVIYPFYPSTQIMSGAFDSDGVGIGIWQKIYRCNGYAGKTPDLRGRSLIGITNMGGGSFGSEVDPANGNPVYNLGDINGQNSVILSSPQMAAHTHTATVVINDPGHHTTIKGASADSGLGVTSGSMYGVTDIEGAAPHGRDVAVDDWTATTTTNDMTGLSDSNVTVTNAVNTPTGEGHSNVHPVLAVNYIMYLP